MARQRGEPPSFEQITCSACGTSSVAYIPVGVDTVGCPCNLLGYRGGTIRAAFWDGEWSTPWMARHPNPHVRVLWGGAPPEAPSRLLTLIRER